MFAAAFDGLPGIDAGPLAMAAWFGLWHGLKASHNPAAGLGWIYHFVDLQNRCDGGRLAVGIEFRNLGLVVFLPLKRIGNRFHFLAEAKPDIAFQSHAAELAGRPCHREEGIMAGIKSENARPCRSYSAR